MLREFKDIKFKKKNTLTQKIKSHFSNFRKVIDVTMIILSLIYFVL